VDFHHPRALVAVAECLLLPGHRHRVKINTDEACLPLLLDNSNSNNNGNNNNNRVRWVVVAR